MSHRGNDALARTILKAFTPMSSDALARSLESYRDRDWRNLGTWLHASGLALYFLATLNSRGVQQSLPPAVLYGLEQNHADNRERTAALAREFLWLNSEFASADLEYVCVKGFCLGSPYFQDATLRSQFDLDFVVPEDTGVEFATLMRRLGYEVHTSGGTLECHAGGVRYPKLSDFYKPPERRSVEIHLRSRDEFEALPRSVGVLNGAVFPVLSRERILVEQAFHLTKHLRSEWTRASWMLEFWHALRAEEHGPAFWSEVRHVCPEPHALQLGIATASCVRVFGGGVPSGLQWACASLPNGVLRWVDEYAVNVAAARFPGTKLYLLLERELSNDGSRFREKRRGALLPLRIPGYIRAGSFRASVRTVLSHARYLVMRMAFHVREGRRLLRAERQWTRGKLQHQVFAAREGGSIA